MVRTFGMVLIGAALAVAGCSGVTINSANNRPEAVIQQPVDGSVHAADDGIELRGRAIDVGAGGGIDEIAWTSNVDGVIFEGLPDDDEGNTLVQWDDPSGGDHSITLRVTDIDGATVEVSVEVTVVDDQPPLCTITSPTGKAVLDSTQPLLLQGQVDDDKDDLDTLAIEWASDVDGVLDTTPANEVGVVGAEVAISASNHELSLTVTDSSGLECTDVVYIVTNGAPSVPGIALEPNPPSIDSDLRVIITTESVDPEGETVEYGYRWFVDEVGVFFPEEADTSLIPMADLARDQVWRVEVYGVDPLEVSSLPAEAETVVPDTAPSAPGVEVTPAEPNQAQDLACAVVADSVDPDSGDIIDYGFGWLVDGSPTSHVGALLPWSETEIGQNWTCEVTPTDGTLFGEPGISTVAVEAGCFSFSGNGGGSHAYVTDDSSLRLGGGDFTVEAWLRPDTFSPDAAVVSKRDPGSDNGWHLAVNSDGEPFFQVSIGANPLVTAESALTLGQWHHVALVYEASSGIGTFFVDGQPDSSGTLPSPNAAATADLLIGGDGAGLGDAWDGLIDDVRLSSVARYGITFIPDTSLGSDADTLALWGFEEGSGSTVHDGSLNGHDGFMIGGSFSSDSTCTLDLPPTAPLLSLDALYPDDGDDLICDLAAVSVDPEGLPVTYSGEWLKDGAPTGPTFTTLPNTLSSSETSEGELWACEVVASDGLQDSTAASVQVYVGSMPVCELAILDPTSAGSVVCAFEAPIDGLLRFNVDNPDGSADGHFLVDLGTLGTTWLFTGFKDWAYDGTTTLPWAAMDIEMNVQPALGPMAVTMSYDPSAGTANSGEDTLSVDFVFNDQLTTSGAVEIGGNEVSSADASDDTPTATNVSATLGAGERLLIEADPCGSAGLGAHGVYASNDGTPNNDGLLRVDTGSGTTCAIPLRSMSLPADSWDFSIVHEDDFWSDNTGDRGLTLYRYSP
ncbi:MAG: LamG domain-containing protein [Proteobacteria bacterium]|nr:LamG domain-containing protein [Pseudomonadota bacterium]